MKIIYFCFFAFMTTTNLKSQTTAPMKQWDKRFGGSSEDQPAAIQRTIDSGYIIGGYTTSGISGDKTEDSRGLFDYWLVKIDANGIKQWDRRFGGANNDYLFSVSQTIDGGYILGGYSSSGIGGDKSEANRDISNNSSDYWVIKIDGNGSKQWDKRFGGTGDDWLFSVQQTKEGGYILGGISRSGISGDKTQKKFDTTNFTFDYWLVKIDANGIKQWDKCFGGSSEEQFGFNSLKQTADSGFILAGSSYSNISGNKTENSRGGGDYWIVKTDVNGIKQWDKSFGGSNEDHLFSVKQTSDNGYILGGWSESSISGDKTEDTWGGGDYWMVKTDVNGIKQWDKRFGGDGIDQMFSLQQTVDGGYILGGKSYSGISGNKTEASWGFGDYWIVKTNAYGTLEWDKRFGGNKDEYLTPIELSNDGGYILGGSTLSGISGDKTQNSRGSWDYWVIKLKNIDSSKIVFYNQNPYGSSALDSAYINDLNDSFILKQKLATNIINPNKICADGSDATYIQYTNDNINVSPFDIAFKVKENTNAQDDIYGSFGVVEVINNNPQIIKVKYNHPVYMDAESVYRSATIQVYNRITGNILCSYPIQIYRAPLLIVHGIFSNSEKMNDLYLSLMRGASLYPGNPLLSPLVKTANYQSTNAASFFDNRQIVQQNIQDLLKQATHQKFSCGKVDIVAHSMGGILSRIYIQNVYNSSPYSSDVHKLITVNTPHSGTQFADFGISTACPAFAFILNFITKTGIGSLLCPTITTNFPALVDLGSNSDAIDKYLNGQTRENNERVPTAAIVTTVNLSNNYPNCSFIQTSLSLFYNSIFYGDEHDDVVPLMSQQGGIEEEATAKITDVCHIGSIGDPNVSDAIRSLINKPTSYLNFDVDGYKPPDLHYSLFGKKYQTISALQSVKFESPANYSTFVPGKIIKVTAQGSTETKSMQLVIGNEIFDPISLDTTGSKLSYFYTIPSIAIGEIRMMVLGYDSTGNFSFDTLRINVRPLSTLDSITVSPATILVPATLKTNFTVTGYYHDGYARNISNLSTIQYSIADTNISVHTILNEIEGKKEDTTNMIISYSGKTKTIPIEVLNGTFYQHAGFISFDTLVCRAQQVHFTNYSTGVPDSVRWVLTGAFPSTSTEQNPVVVYNKPGIYDAKLICYYSQKNDTLLLSQYIRVINKAPARPGTIIISKGTNKTCPGDTISYSINPVANATSYLWKTPTGATILSGQGTTSINVYYSSTFIKTDSVNVAAVNSCGTGPIRYSKIILKCNSFSSVYSSTSVISKDVKLIVFPNPFKNTIYLKGNLINAKNCRIILTDILGRVYFDKLFVGNNSEIEINTEKLQRGFYFLSIKTDNRREVLKVEKL